MPDKFVLLLGATGTIGRATAQALVDRGHHVTCLVRPNSKASLPGVTLRYGSATDPTAMAETLATTQFDALISCLASRTGSPDDAWAIDHKAHSQALHLAKARGVTQMVLLSAICVQRPLLAFQHAKLAFEAELASSGLIYSIVRPTAYFKSLSGQVERVRQGKPFLLFGDGQLTACKPISDADLAQFLVDCLSDPAKHNKILPIGGPGPAITPLQQGEVLFSLLDRKPRYRHVPVAMMDAIIGTLSALGRLSPHLRDKAELARIGRYYATESMLVLNPHTGRYDADATPSTGSETLFAFYARLTSGQSRVDLGEHAVFQRNA